MDYSAPLSYDILITIMWFVRHLFLSSPTHPLLSGVFCKKNVSFGLHTKLKHLNLGERRQNVKEHLEYTLLPKSPKRIRPSLTILNVILEYHYLDPSAVTRLVD
jgi:hypothetical protein